MIVRHEGNCVSEMPGTEVSLKVSPLSYPTLNKTEMSEPSWRM